MIPKEKVIVVKPVEISLPFIGGLRFDRAEIDKLLRYIQEAQK